MQQCILLSHVFIRDGEKDKIDKVEFALKHWRKYNPNAHIVVTGHGIRPDIGKYCDHIIWPTKIIQKDISVIKTNHLKHIEDDVKKMDTRLWAILLLLVASMFIPFVKGLW